MEVAGETQTPAHTSTHTRTYTLRTRTCRSLTLPWRPSRQAYITGELPLFALSRALTPAEFASSLQLCFTDFLSSFNNVKATTIIGVRTMPPVPPASANGVRVSFRVMVDEVATAAITAAVAEGVTRGPVCAVASPCGLALLLALLLALWPCSSRACRWSHACPNTHTCTHTHALLTIDEGHALDVAPWAAPRVLQHSHSRQFDAGRWAGAAAVASCRGGRRQRAGVP